MLYSVVCDLKNTGNLPIKDESIRFEFSKGTIFVDDFKPEAEKEMEVEELQNDPKFKLEAHEKRYKISSIKIGEKIRFRFVVVPTQGESLTMTPHHFNGDVNFIPASIQEVEDETYQLTKFIYLFLLFIILPSVFGFIPFFGSEVVGFARLAILMSISPFMKPVSKILADRILRRGNENPLSYHTNISKYNMNMMSEIVSEMSRVPNSTVVVHKIISDEEET